MYAATPFWAFFWGGNQSFLEDVSITLIDKTDRSNLLQRENYWRSILKTMAPRGLNAEDCVSNSILLCSYYWICTDCNKDLIYGNDLWYRLLMFLFSSLSLLFPFLWLFFVCFFRFVTVSVLRDCVGVLLVIIIEVVLIVAAIVVIFVGVRVVVGVVVVTSVASLLCPF